MQRELSLVCLYVLEENKAGYFQPDDPLFGAVFERAFPSAIFELEEAAKCLALDRPTAAVFHLMRIMENRSAGHRKKFGDSRPDKSR